MTCPRTPHFILDRESRVPTCFRVGRPGLCANATGVRGHGCYHENVFCLPCAVETLTDLTPPRRDTRKTIHHICASHWLRGAASHNHKRKQTPAGPTVTPRQLSGNNEPRNKNKLQNRRPQRCNLKNESKGSPCVAVPSVPGFFLATRRRAQALFLRVRQPHHCALEERGGACSRSCSSPYAPEARVCCGVGG